MSSFTQHYRSLFDLLGYPLATRSAVSKQRIADAEARLHITAPAALRDYYLVAGNERRFNQCFNRLLAPERWSVDRKRLLFMEENQAMLWWGVSLRNPSSQDPNISQGINDDPIRWHSEARRCSAFLQFMIHYHAVNGGLPYSGRANVPDDTEYRLDEHGWKSYGRVGSVSAYSRPRQVICLTPPGDLPFMQQWSVTAAAKTKASFASLEKEIGLTFS